MRPTKYDGLLVAICLSVALLAGGVVLLFHLTDRPLVAVVTVNDAVVARLPLDMDTTCELTTGHTVIVQNGAVSVASAPCPDKICETYADARHLGACIVCLPEKMVITVEEETP